MKKEIILQEADFEQLKRDSESWEKYQRNNLRFVRFNLVLDRRPLRSYFPAFQMDIEGDIPEELEIRLNQFSNDIKSHISQTTRKEQEQLEERLNKIPNWIKNLFT